MNNNFISIVKSALEGDKLAFEALYNATKDSAYFVALNITQNKQDAEDILHNSYIKAFQNLKTLANPENFDKWFNTIVSNTAKDYIKKKKPTLFANPSDFQGELIEEENNSSYIPHQYVDNEETNRLIMEIINKLPEDQRLCILMYYYQDMSIAEISKTLDLSVSNVKYKLSVARKKIKQGVEDLEKRGTKLYGIFPFAVISDILNSTAKKLASSATTPVYSSVFTQRDISAFSSIATSSAKAGFLSTVAGKIIAAVTAAVIICGSVTTIVILSNKRDSYVHTDTPSLSYSQSSEEHSNNPQNNGQNSTGSIRSETSSLSTENSNFFEFTIENDTATLIKYKGNLNQVAVPSTYQGLPVTKIGNSAFAKNTELTSIGLPDTIKVIEYSAFYKCTSLENINIPNSVEEIQGSAFFETPWFKEIEATSDGEVYIGSVLYKYVGKMPANTKLHIKEGTTYISSSLFSKSSGFKKNLIEVVIPEGVKGIDDTAFKECAALKKVTFPSTLKTIGSSAFDSCSALEELNIPKGVKTIEFRAFDHCSSLKSVNFPDTLEVIEWEAFNWCESLKNINIPNGVKTIGERAFSGCKALESAVISSEKIEKYIFKNCPNLKDITFTESVKYIYTDALGTIGSAFTLHVKANSQGEEYAKENNIKFVVE